MDVSRMLRYLKSNDSLHNYNHMNEGRGIVCGLIIAGYDIVLNPKSWIDFYKYLREFLPSYQGSDLAPWVAMGTILFVPPCVGGLIGRVIDNIQKDRYDRKYKKEIIFETS